MLSFTTCWNRPPSSTFMGHDVMPRRWISIGTAKQVLGFPPHHRPTMKELRLAYFEAAKRTHPDSYSSLGTNNDGTGSTGGEDFCRVTEAYERLSGSCDMIGCGGRSKDDIMSWRLIISREEEEEYRRACQDVLGIPAEIVEESKQNPMFRHWLNGNTDGAQHWRAFFAVHGGLAQKLARPVAYIESGQETATFETRRRRKR